MTTRWIVPDDQTYAEVTNWPITKDEDALSLLAFVKRYWWSTGDLWTEGINWNSADSRRTFAISTGGWSENEGLIMAMRDNTTFWHRYWYVQRRGGHYVFEVPRP